MNATTLHYYRQARLHQMQTYGIACHLFVDGVDQRQFTGGGAAYGFHAYAAFLSAKRTIHFRATLSADVADHKRRSNAAKKAWRTRQSNLSFAA